MNSSNDSVFHAQLSYLCGRPAVVVLLVIHAALAISSLRQKSLTYDEPVRLTAGYSYWVTGDYRLDPAEPPFAQMWATVPLLIGEYRFPDRDQSAWWRGEAQPIARQFLFECGNDTAAIVFRARTMMVLLSVALGAVVYVWSRRLFGPAGGMLSLLLYAFSPSMLAHARLVTTETATCLFFVAALGGVLWVLHEVCPLSVLASGLVLAGLFLSKMSAPLILVVGVLMLGVRLISSQPLRVRLGRSFSVQRRVGRLAVWVGAITVQVAMTAGGVWAAHRFRYEGMVDAAPGRDRYCPPMRLPPHVDSWDYVLKDAGPIDRTVAWFRRHRLLPEAYLYGVAYQFDMIQIGYAFLNGHRNVTGWCSFFPYTLVVKTPLALFGLLLLAVAAALARRRRDPSARQTDPATVSGVLAILIFLAAYWATALGSHLNIGHRHILPTYPFMFILAGGAAAWWWRGPRLMRWLTAGCAALFALAALRIHPDYLAYFNMLAGGPENAYKHLVDSSLDWGQDLPALKTRLDQHARTLHFAGAPGPVYLSYFGTDNPERFGIDAIMLPSHLPWQPSRLEPLRTGLYCISATMLQLMYAMPTNAWTESYEGLYQLLKPDCERAERPIRVTQDDLRAYWLLRFARLCSALRARRPDDAVNYTILIYRLTDDQIAAALDGPPIEVVPDDPLTQGPEQLVWMSLLGRLSARRGLDDQALRQFQRVLHYDPGHVEAASGSARILVDRGQFDRATTALRRTVERNPSDIRLLNDLAWLLATAPRAADRDGSEAIRLAERACRLSKEEHLTLLDTLAAACAEAGQFARALQCAQRAEALARQGGLTSQADQIAKRIALYETHTPYHQHARPPTRPATRATPAAVQ